MENLKDTLKQQIIEALSLEDFDIADIADDAAWHRPLYAET